MVTSNGLVRRPCLILKDEEGKYDRVAYYHSKKDTEPIVTLKVGEYVSDIVDEFIHKDQKVLGNRNMLLTELSEDGNEVHLWMSKAFDIAHDTLFHPRSIYKQVVDNCATSHQTQPSAANSSMLSIKSCCQPGKSFASGKPTR